MKNKNGEPRGVLPTHVTDDLLVLCKSASEIRNTYEVRLALFFAVDSNRRFMLAVPHGAIVDPHLEAHVCKFGGEIARDDIRDYSVYFGAIDADGVELDGWVLGDNDRWNDLLLSFPCDQLKIGATFFGPQLGAFAEQVSTASIDGANIDNEALVPAILQLIALAQREGGMLYIQ
jgi:hypothetical protein